MKKQYLFFCSILLLVFCLFCFIGCNDSKHKKEPEITEFEESIVGEWLLYDVTYIQYNNSNDPIIYTYPSSSDVFNSFYIAHVEKTKIIFERRAYDVFPVSNLYKTGTLYDGENSIKLGWHQRDEGGIAISFSDAIKLDVFDGEKVSKARVTSALAVTKNGNTTLLIAPGIYTTYRFKKIE